MKANKLFVLVFFIFFESCCSIFNIGCDNCEDIKAGAEYADLLLQNFETEIGDENGDSIVYNIIHTILNFASDFECPDIVDGADSHSDELQLIYSSTEDFVNPEIVEVKTANINKVTPPNSNYQVVSEISFVQDGYYLVENTIDNTDLVVERNENNIFDQNTPLATRIINTPEKYKIIHITKDMLSKVNINNRKGKTKFINSWDVRIVF